MVREGRQGLSSDTGAGPHFPRGRKGKGNRRPGRAASPRPRAGGAGLRREGHLYVAVTPAPPCVTEGETPAGKAQGEAH